MEQEVFNMVKMSWRVNIPSPLRLQKEYDLTIGNVECRKVEDVPNDDWSISKIFTLKISWLSEVNIISERELVQSQKKWSQSQLQKLLILDIADKLWVDRESYYTQRMSDNIKRLEEELWS
jgi:hypothetical protein